MDKSRKIISLDGDWSFAYTMELPDPQQVSFPDEDRYEVQLPVPAYWDDCKDRLKFAKFWSRDVRFYPGARRIEEFPLGGLKPPDASLPYMLGTGWYKKRFKADSDWNEKSVTLHIGGAMLDVQAVSIIFPTNGIIGCFIDVKLPGRMQSGLRIG